METIMKELSKRDTGFWNPEGSQNLLQNMTPDTKRILGVFVFMVVIYLMLLLPYLVASNSGESGIVSSVQKIDITSLPRDIQDLIPYKEKQYYAIVVVDDTDTVKDLKGQISKERKLILSPMPAQINEFIRADNILINIFAPANLIPVTDQEFHTLIIGDANRVGYGEIVEFSNFLRITPILVASRIVFYIGAFIIILGFSLLFNKKTGLWCIFALISCYSFQFFLASRIASANHLETDLIILLFSFMFLPALYLAFKVKEYEVSEKGKKRIVHLYRRNLEIFHKIKLKIKEILSFG